MTLYMITKQIHALFLYEATRCCRASLEGAAFLSSSQVRLCSVICYGKYFTSELNKINKKCDYDITKQIHMVFLFRMLHAVVARRWREPPFSVVARCVYVPILLLLWQIFY